MANFKASAEAQALARARETEHREYVEAQRHRETAMEAMQMASRATHEAETARAWTTTRLKSSEKAAEDMLVAKTANLTLEAEQAVHNQVGRCENEVREERRKLQEEINAVEMRERTSALRQELASEGSLKREDSRTRERARFQEAMMEKMQLELIAIHRRSREDQDRMERELWERDNAYRADALQKQQAIENLTHALSVALTKLDARPPLTASGGAPPPPPGGGNAPVGEEFYPKGKQKKASGSGPAPSCSLAGNTQTTTRTRMAPPPPPGGGGDPGGDSGEEDPEEFDDDFDELGDEDDDRDRYPGNRRRSPGDPDGDDWPWRARARSPCGHPPGSRGTGEGSGIHQGCRFP
jgi:hypothetical protein